MTAHGEVHVGLVSGGQDSTVAAAVAEEKTGLDILVYLDTRTGLESNRRFCEELADHLDLQLWTLRTHVDYEQRVIENGFPGPSRHSMYYTLLKERQIGKLATVAGGRGQDGELHLHTGVRSDESEQRMRRVEAEQSEARWTWIAPIHDWSKSDCVEYIDEHDLPRNELWSGLGRSGDCFCGAFGNPSEKIDLRAAEEGQHADWIESLEDDVDVSDETARWAWGALSPQERRAVRSEEDDSQMTLCSSCGFNDGGDR